MKTITLSRYLLLLCFFSFVIFSCSKDNEDDLEKEKQRISNEVKSNLSDELVFMATNSSSIFKSNFHGSSFQISNSSLDGPKWSPDGHNIAFTTTDTNNIFIKIFNKDGTEVKSWLLLPSNQLTKSKLTWSPDGNSIAVLISASEIIYLNISTGEKSRIQIDNGTSNTMSIAWSSKNNKIAIGQLGSISMIDAFINNPVKELLVNQVTAEYMDWNANGSKLVYSGYGWGYIYTVNDNGSENQKIVSKGVFENKKVWGFAPCWLSNGEQIVYVGVTGVQGSSLLMGLFVTDINGSYIVDLNINGRQPDCY